MGHRTREPAIYRKRPILVQALQFDSSALGCEAVTKFTGGPFGGVVSWRLTTYMGGIVRTLEGDMAFGPGDWIIKGITGEFYPCRDDIFQATYEQFTPELAQAEGDAVQHEIVEARRRAEQL